MDSDPQELTSVAADPAYEAIRAELEVELARLRAELGVVTKGEVPGSE